MFNWLFSSKTEEKSNSENIRELGSSNTTSSLAPSDTAIKNPVSKFSNFPGKKIECKLESIPSRHKKDSLPIIKNVADVTPSSPVTSGNWSGYASTAISSGTGVTYVFGSFTVPPITVHSTSNAYSAFWAGIDGLFSNTVEQLGISCNSIGGQQTYSAWFEMYPQGSYGISSFPVFPGDIIGVEVIYKGNNVFSLSIGNYTKQVYYEVPASYTTVTYPVSLSSAEWVAEAPSVGGVAPLADFGTSFFTSSETTINGYSGTIDSPGWTSWIVTMVGEIDHNLVKAAPALLSPDGKSFTLKWSASGP